MQTPLSNPIPQSFLQKAHNPQGDDQQYNTRKYIQCHCGKASGKTSGSKGCSWVALSFPHKGNNERGGAGLCVLPDALSTTS